MNGTAINVIRLNDHRCNKLAVTSKSRGHKLVILFVHFLLEDTGLIHQVSYNLESTQSTIKRFIYQRVWSTSGWWHGIDLKELEVFFESRRNRSHSVKHYFIYIAICTCYKQKARYFIIQLSYMLEFGNSGTNFIEITRQRGLSGIRCSLISEAEIKSPLSVLGRCF